MIPAEAEPGSGSGRRRGGRGRGRGRNRPLDADANTESRRPAELPTENLAEVDEATAGDRRSRSRRRRQPRAEAASLTADGAPAGGEAEAADVERDDRPAARPDGARRQPRRRRERPEMPEQILLPTIPEVEQSETTPTKATDIQLQASAVESNATEPDTPSADIGTTDLPVASLFLAGDSASGTADDAAPVASEQFESKGEGAATVPVATQPVAVPIEFPNLAAEIQEPAPAVPVEPQRTAPDAVVEEKIPEVTAAAVRTIGRANNDPRATPRPVTHLEVVSTRIEVPVSGFIDTSQPAPIPRERVELPRPPNDPRRGRVAPTSGQQGGEVSG